MYLRNKRSQSFALIVTLVMVVLAAIITVALLTNATLDRATASAFSKRFRAEMAAQSGLAAALNALVGAGGPTDFRYVTAVGDDSKPVLVPLKYDPASGVTSLDNARQRPLYSSGAQTTTLTLSSTATPKPTPQVGYVSVTNTANQEVERYAFYVDEGGSRQNLSVQAGASRTYTRDPNELPLVTAAASGGAPFSAAQNAALSDDRSLIFTPQTANPILSGANVPVTPQVDDYSFATASAIANLAPDGNPRVDLQRLKDYVDGLAIDQVSGNARAKVVDRLLTPGEKGGEWGPDASATGKPGGNLSFLTKLSHYNSQQCHQIVANLLDYLDSDLIPTTDNVDSPTYFGVEGQADTTGNVVGHPYINFVGTGIILNRSGAAGNIGGLNSTRIVLVLGLVNPWTTKTKDWDTFYVEPEVTIHITGTASGGTLGGNASDYFQENFSSQAADPSGNPEKLYPVKNIPANTGYCFPVKMSGTTNYSTFKDLKGTMPNGLGQPPGIVFTNLGFQIKKLRLKFVSTSGGSGTGYVQVLDNLTNTPQPASPTTVDCGHTNVPPSLIYKFTGSAPGYDAKTDFHLNGDPRLNFLAPNASFASWILSKSTESGTNPPAPGSIIAIFTGSDSKNWDFAGGTPSVSNSLWYTKKDITADFYVKSPPAKDPNNNSYPEPNLKSAGEIGYLHTGIPWETLRLYVTGDEQGGKERDKELLAYVHSGTFNSADYGTVPTHVGQSDPQNPIPMAGGPLNINTSKRPTLQSLFLGVTALTDAQATSRANAGGDADATTIANALAQNASATPLALASDLLALPAIKPITGAPSADFDREIVARRAANVLGTQSTRFTVYTLGEARDNVAGAIVTSSKVNLRAEVELQTDSSGKPMPRILSTTYYLTN